MTTAQTPTEVTEEQEKKRSPWLIVIIILLLLMIGCCCIGVFLCRGSSRLPELLPDEFEEILKDIPFDEIDPDSDFWEILETAIPDPDVLEPDLGVLENDCKGVSGEFEMQVLVGPAAAVGLEPFGIGSIPFTVEFDQGAYTVQGDGYIDFEDMLEEEWGTYTVYFDMYGVVDGVCTQGDDGGVLDINLQVSGEQMFVVDSAFYEEYPWEGEHEFDFSFPVEDGAMESDPDGTWAFILHLD